MSRELQRLLNEAAYMIRKQDESTARKRSSTSSPSKPTPTPSASKTANLRPDPAAARKKAQKHTLLTTDLEVAPALSKPVAIEPIRVESKEAPSSDIDNSWILNPTSSKLKRLAMLVEAAQYMEAKMERNKLDDSTSSSSERDARRGKRTATQQLEPEEPLQVKKPFLG